MSWQAMEAVQDHSKLDDHTALCIMYAVARCADDDGVAGSRGRVTAPSIDTIARYAHCHRNTVLNWLPRLEESGELLVERFGKGRGSWNRYTILLPMPVNGTSNGTSTIDHNAQSNGTSDPATPASNGTSYGTKWYKQDVPDTYDTKNPPNPPTDSNADPDSGEERQEEESEPIVDLAEYFCQITGRKMPYNLRSTHAGTYWWEPLVEIYNQHDSFLDTKRAMYAAVQYANDVPLTVTTPHSLRNLAVASARDKSGYRDKSGMLVVSGR